MLVSRPIFRGKPSCLIFVLRINYLNPAQTPNVSNRIKLVTKTYYSNVVFTIEKFCEIFQETPSVVT